MFRQLPNLITASRLLLAIVFFGFLAYYQYEGRGDPTFLNTAFAIYVVALFSDFLDGYLARKYKLESAFGRVVDPFVDKILVLGSFIFFAGKNFIIPDYAAMKLEPNEFYVVKTITGVAPYMVVILLARELLITALRSVAEGGGTSFGAQFSGKLKMVFQSVTILVILVYVRFRTQFEANASYDYYATITRDVCIWLTIGITVISGGIYLQKILQKSNLIFE